MVSKKGQYWPYYRRIGRGKKKKYRCIFCGYELPKYSSICSHLERTHGKDIDENERKKREWKEEQKRKKEEEKNSVTFAIYYEDPFTGEVSPIEEEGI